jgi:hypothetical protein
MSDTAEKKLSKAAVAELRKLRLEAMNLQEIEGNPLDAEDIAMFEREGWDDDRCRAYINALARELAGKSRARLDRRLGRQPCNRLCPDGGGPSGRPETTLLTGVDASGAPLYKPAQAAARSRRLSFSTPEIRGR